MNGANGSTIIAMKPFDIAGCTVGKGKIYTNSDNNITGESLRLVLTICPHGFISNGNDTVVIVKPDL